MVKKRLESWFLGWIFVTLDARGCSGGLVVGWKVKSIKVVSLWGMELVLGLKLQALDLQTTFIAINIYGPYLNRVPFWEGLFNNPLLCGESVILGGDLNFSLGHAEVWVLHA